ncbi:hepatitis A virus cellular receptor 1 isoform X5 [Ictalurus punctatus]|uniref:Hepatitis A virus cellular receptor 1 isoform X5 n=1 Tax=Ictalurus punctatus TaxID=7998 RepID=A0A2D0Q2E1_ICTPU|nr:hepatitis A virus cellular receptor 1 isoform X5 [Ictalurus punctatus]
MNQLHCWISSFGLLLCLTVCTCSPMNIWRIEGQDVTIPCRYNSHYHGTCDVCWMRGSIPRSGCGNQIIYATGKNVVMRGNRRYQLNGNLQKGDASLTILNARISDSGKYGCRIHVPGWFNDIKMEVYLIITEAPKPSTTLRHITTTTRVPTHGPVLTTQDDISTVPEHVTTSHTGPVLTTQDDISTVPEHVTTSHTETQQTFTTLEYVTTTTHIPTQRPDLTTQDETTTAHEIVTTKHTETQQTTSTLGYVTTVTHIPTQGPVLTTQDETSTAPEHVTAKHTGPVLTTQDDISTVPEHVTTSHTETQQTFTTLEYVTTTTHIPTQRPDLTTQDETTTAHEIVTTKHTGPVLTTQDETSTAPEHVTTKHTGPVLTTQDDISTVPEHVTTSHTGPDLTTQDETTTAHEIVTTKHTETQQTTSTLGYVTTVTHIPTQGPVLTTQDETSTAPEHVTTKHTVVIAENDIDVSSSEKEMLVNEDPGVLPAILVPVILILAVLGISAVYFISKQKRRFRSTIELAKNSSVNYNNLDSSVTLPITNLFNN